eukprot:357696-Chlamydomonas_euryale.AAC.1
MSAILTLSSVLGLLPPPPPSIRKACGSRTFNPPVVAAVAAVAAAAAVATVAAVVASCFRQPQVGSQTQLLGPLIELNIMEEGSSFLLQRYSLTEYPRQFSWGSLQELARSRQELLVGCIKGC